MSRRMIASCAAAVCAIAGAGAIAAAQPAAPERPAVPSEAAQPTPPPDPAQPGPSPTEPSPTEPSPAEPPPAEPSPAEPSPVEPSPAEPGPARREPAPAEPEPAPESLDEIGDQGIGGSLGLAAGGRTTPGGLRISGHYLYQLSEQDWFDGIASFTFGSGDPACFRDRSDDVVCDHGLASGRAIEVAAAVRRMFQPQGRFRPFLRAAVGLAIVRFSGDELAGLAIPLHAGAGLRAAVAPGVAIIALAEATLGLAAFGRDVGGEPQLGLAITAGAEVRLR